MPQQSQEYGGTGNVADLLAPPTGDEGTEGDAPPEGGAADAAAAAAAPPSIVPLFEAQFIACEECALEGDRHTHFDRKQARELHEVWKTAELERRSKNPTEPAVAICDTKMSCSGLGGHLMSVVDVIAAKVQEMTLLCMFINLVCVLITSNPLSLYTHTHIHTYIHTHIHTHTHTHTQTHTNTHTGAGDDFTLSALPQ
jgi:hypothetical protein